MELRLLHIDKPDDMNVIIGHAHFIKTVEDLHEAIVGTNPGMQFGLAFCEASGPSLVRFSGNNQRLMDLAKKNALSLGCGHTFMIFMEGGFPINILNAIKSVPEVCSIHCATANPVDVIIAEAGEGCGILGVIDGVRSNGIESETDIRARKEFIRRIGYKAT